MRELHCQKTRKLGQKFAELTRIRLSVNAHAQEAYLTLWLQNAGQRQGKQYHAGCLQEGGHCL